MYIPSNSYAFAEHMKQPADVDGQIASKYLHNILKES